MLGQDGGRAQIIRDLAEACERRQCDEILIVLVQLNRIEVIAAQKKPARAIRSITLVTRDDAGALESMHPVVDSEPTDNPFERPILVN